MANLSPHLPLPLSRILASSSAFTTTTTSIIWPAATTLSSAPSPSSLAFFHKKQWRHSATFSHSQQGYLMVWDKSETHIELYYMIYFIYIIHIIHKAYSHLYILYILIFPAYTYFHRAELLGLRPAHSIWAYTVYDTCMYLSNQSYVSVVFVKCTFSVRGLASNCIRKFFFMKGSHKSFFCNITGTVWIFLPGERCRPQGDF